ncbi:MAG: CpXC domain-containing protein [Patescibacteria group bacterium]
MECNCGNIVDVVLHQSVNVTINPALAEDVINRKINNCYCKKCGIGKELVFQFLYVDMRKNKWIWCYPEKEKSSKDQIEKEINNFPVNKFLEEMRIEKPIIAFGYNELFSIINIGDKQDIK